MRSQLRHPENEQLLRYADGELPSRQARKIKAHLESCWQCRAVVIAAWPAAAFASREARPSPGSSSATCRVASAPSIATSVSASRCRIAWKPAIGRPNCTRSSACCRAKASIALDAPTSHQPTARR